jgi:SAM-dependent methyltransferase
MVKLDIGCGSKKKEGFIGVDQYAMAGVDIICKVGKDPLPFKDGEVEEIYSSHFFEHLSATERTFLYNEMYRVLAPGAKATIIVPHWNSNRAYGDPTHQWPPVSEMSFFYLNKQWRKEQAPHTDSEWNPEGFNCDFEATWGYSLNPALVSRNPEFQQFALSWYKEAVQDIMVSLTKKV